ncbi:diguanylate cyclase domain-containing protein [Marinobacter sp.]|uniref:diguanylate cyclase domain-containing protein n=1 Tax=Marinobacter sp. TaxID=50741 RepID=UPI003562E6B4
MGDHLLQEVAVEIAACVRSTDTISRHGGDDFVILLTETAERQDAIQVAEKLLARFAEPRVNDDHELRINLSIGISDPCGPRFRALSASAGIPPPGIPG